MDDGGAKVFKLLAVGAVAVVAGVGVIKGYGYAQEVARQRQLAAGTGSAPQLGSGTSTGGGAQGGTTTMGAPPPVVGTTTGEPVVETGHGTVVEPTSVGTLIDTVIDTAKNAVGGGTATGANTATGGGSCRLGQGLVGYTLVTAAAFSLRALPGGTIQGVRHPAGTRVLVVRDAPAGTRATASGSVWYFVEIAGGAPQRPVRGWVPLNAQEASTCTRAASGLPGRAPTPAVGRRVTGPGPTPWEAFAVCARRYRELDPAVAQVFWRQEYSWEGLPEEFERRRQPGALEGWLRSANDPGALAENVREFCAKLDHFLARLAGIRSTKTNRASGLTTPDITPGGAVDPMPEGPAPVTLRDLANSTMNPFAPSYSGYSALDRDD